MGIEQVIDDGFRRARERGWPAPALVAVRLSVGMGERVREALLAGEYLALPDDPPFFVLLAQHDAVSSALSGHAGPGGGFVSRVMADLVAGIDGWMVVLETDGIHYTSFRRGHPAIRGKQPYDHVAPGQKTLAESLADDRPTQLEMLTRGGDKVTLFGRTGKDAARVGSLAAIVNRGERLMGDDALANVLAEEFSGESGPHQVAEAVRALKKLPGNKERRLLRVLRNRPSLTDLNRRVRQELTGEAG